MPTATSPPPIFISGHQRPDTDAAVSACVTARLRGRLQPLQPYEAILLGEANRQTAWIFEQAGISLPPVRPDIRETVGERMNRQFHSLPTSAHLAEAMKLLHEAAGLIPVVNEADGTLAGVLSERLPQGRYFYNFNAEDYLGSLIHLSDLISALGLKPLNGPVQDGPSVPGAFRLAGCTQEAREAWSAADVILTAPHRETLAAAQAAGVSAVILAECDPLPAAEWAAEFPVLPLFHFGGSLMCLVSQLPLAIPVSVIMEQEFQTLSPGQSLAEVRSLVAHSAHALPVVDEHHRLIGTLSRGDLLEMPRRQIILVDHFEKGQSVKGLEEAEIVEIIDHHRVGNVETPNPVRVDCRPVGSTASIVAAHFAEAGLEPTPGEAMLLLGALISDTLLLTSPTTAPSDHPVAARLAALAGVDLQTFGREVLRQNDELATAAPDRLVERDLKEFQHGATHFAAGQIETVDLEILTDGRRDELAAELTQARRRLGVAFALLMVTDVFRRESFVLVSDDQAARAGAVLGAAPGEAGGRRFAGMVSRKKQLLPMVLQNLEAFAAKAAA